MKRFFALILSCLIMASIAIPAFAADNWTLKYDMNGETTTPTSIADVVVDQTATVEERTTKVAAYPSSETKTCKEWNTKADGTGIKWEADQNMEIASDITLYAIWEVKETYKLSYSANSVELYLTTLPETKSYDAGTAASIAKTPKSKSFVFKEWNTKADGTGTSYEAGSNIVMKEDTTLYAIWTEVKDGFYLLRYDLNGAPGTAPADQTAAYWKDVKVAAAPTVSGYTFKEWNTRADGTGKAYAPGSDYYRYDHDVFTLYAIWSKIPVNSHTFTCIPVIDEKENKDLVKPAQVEEGAAIKAPEIEGYEFVAWYAKFADGKLSDEVKDPKMPKEDYTLYASYKKSDKLKLTFETDIGKKFDPIMLAAGADIQFPETKDDNYVFIGWYSDKEMTKEFKETKMPATNTTIYAKYAIKLSALKTLLDNFAKDITNAIGTKLSATELNTVIKAAGYKIVYKINDKEFEIADYSKISDEILASFKAVTKYESVSNFELTFTQNGKIVDETATVKKLVFNDIKDAAVDPSKEDPTKNNSNNGSNGNNNSSNNSQNPTNSNSNKSVEPDVDTSGIPHTGSQIGLTIGAVCAIAVVVVIVVALKKKPKKDEEVYEGIDDDEE